MRFRWAAGHVVIHIHDLVQGFQCWQDFGDMNFPFGNIKFCPGVDFMWVIRRYCIEGGSDDILRWI